MTEHEFAMCIQDAGYSLADGYSGRGMRGETCLAFRVESGSLIAAAAKIMAEAVDMDLVPLAVSFCRKALVGAKVDSLGRESVVYFPSIREPRV